MTSLNDATLTKVTYGKYATRVPDEVAYGIYSSHIRNICKKSGQRVGVINRLRNLISQNAKLQLFKGAILPHLTYCSTVWNFCRASDSRKLERVQERALRLPIRNCYKGQNYPPYIIEGSKILQS